MIPRHSAKYLTIGAAAAFAFGITSTAVAQNPADTASARADTTPAVSQQRIPVTKQQGTYDTTTSTGTLSTPYDTTSTRSGVDTTMSNTSTYPDTLNRDTTGIVTDTSTGSVSTGVSADTTTRQGITGINDTTVNADTTMRDTLMTDTSTAMPTDTTVTPNTTVPTDTTTRADTSVVPGESTSVSTSTTTVTHTEADTVGMYPSSSRLGRLGRGFWLGVGGGASVPIGNLHDGGYDTGWNVTVPIGWQSASTPWGLRLDLSYNRLNGGTINTAPVSTTLSDANVWSGALDLTLQFPFGSSGSSFYLMGGGGIHHFTDVGSDNGAAIIDGTALSSSADNSLTKAGVNGGLGLNFGFGRAKLFLESRFVSVFTEGKNSNYVPIILGVRLF
ncbi:MAG TPA: hypothetical protein VFK39_08775 [Gemmatimonadaceae bacterium]|jgi:hypothetical protein|nr:hypothetical protein [Gemmatimonadaceae bacterium]